MSLAPCDPSAVDVPPASVSPPAAPVLARVQREADHWVVFWLAAVVLFLSFVLKSTNDTQVHLPILDVPLPELCSFRRFTGVDCLGCGLTRSFISAAHGDLPRAWGFHRVGLVFFALVAAQIPYRLYAVRRLRRGLPNHNHWTLTAIPALLMSAMLVNWVIRLAETAF